MSTIVQHRGQIFSAFKCAGRRGLLLGLLLAGVAAVVPAWAQAPANNNFTNAEVIMGPSGTFAGSSQNATRETNEPIHYVGSPLSASSVWFKWVSPAAGPVTFDTVGSGFDTVLAAYRLNGTNGFVSLTPLASDDDSGGVYPDTSSRVTFNALFNAMETNTYYIAVDGYNFGFFGGASEGPYILNWTMDTNRPPIFVQPDVIQFSSPTYSVVENQAFATIAVWYGGDSMGGALGDVSVDFSTTNGTAIDGTHYVGTNVTLIFAPGETVKTLTIPVTDDLVLNNYRTVLLRLSNPTNASVFPTNSFNPRGDSAVLTIVDDEAPLLSTAGQFNFSSANYIVTENETFSGPFGLPTAVGYSSLQPSAPGVLVTVTRTPTLPGFFGSVGNFGSTAREGARGRVIVDWATTTITTTGGGGGGGGGRTQPAKEGVDFFPTSGTLVFDDFQMSATFVVPVDSDSISNNLSKSFGLVLSNPRPAPEEYATVPDLIVPYLGPQSNATVQVMEVNERFTSFSIERSNYRATEHVRGAAATNLTHNVSVDVILPGGGAASVKIRMLRSPARYGFDSLLQPGSDFADGDSQSFANPIYTDGTAPIVNNPDVDFQDQVLSFNDPRQNPVGAFRQKATFTITNDSTVEFNEDVRFELYEPSTGYGIGNGSASLTILFDDQPAGAVDREWNPQDIARTQPPFNATPGANNTVAAVAVQPDNRTVIVGDFTAVNSISRNHVARFNPDGSLDLGFNPGSGADAFVTTLAICTNSPTPANIGKIVIGGGFSSVNGIARRGIARLNSNGSVDTTFKPGNGANGTVNSVALQSDGKILVAGDFTQFNDLPVNGIMRLNEDGTLDTTFDPGTGANGAIRAVAVRDTAGAIFAPRTAVGTELEDVNVIDVGATAGSITVDYDFLSIPDNIRIYYDGARIFELFTNDIGQIVVPFGPGISTSVTIIMNEGIGIPGTIWGYRAFVTPVLTERTIFVAGEFTGFNGQTRNGVARLLDNGTLDPAFDPGIGVNGPIYAMAVQANGRVLIGGAFTTFHTQKRNSLARLLSSGTLDAEYHIGDGADDSIYSIVLQPDGKALIGGPFTSYNGTRRMSIARLFEKGSLDTSFMDTAYNQFAGLARTFSYDPARFVNSIALGPDGNVVIGGSFTNVGGNFSIDRSLDLNTGFFLESGEIKGGSFYAPFTRADRTTRFNVARLIGGYTYGPGNLEYDPNAMPFAIDENAGNFYATVRRVDGRLGSAQIIGTVQNNTAQVPDDVLSTSALAQWFEAAYVAPRSVGEVGLQYLQIPIVDDPLHEGDETFGLSTAPTFGGLTLGGEFIPLGTSRGYVDSALTTITDNDFDHGVFNFAINNFVTNENATAATITVIRTNGTSGSVSVDYYIQDGTALGGQDYTNAPGVQRLTFAAGQSSRSFTINLLNNPEVEEDETVQLVLTNATGGASLPGGLVTSIVTGTLTIVDDDFLAGRVNFIATNYVASESATQALITVTRTGGNLGVLSVQYATADGTAVAPADYAARAGTLTWNSGDSSAKTIVIPLVADGLVEGDQTINLSLFNPSIAGALGPRASATLTVLDGDAYGTLSFSQPRYEVGENDSIAIITVLRSGGIGGTVSAAYSTTPGTAIPGTDYNNTSGVLTFGPGVLSQTFQVQVIDDADPDGDKTFAISLTAPVNGSLGGNTNVLVTLVDNESVSSAAGSLDTTFSANSAANGSVYALALQTNGAIIMAGDFTEVGSVPRSRLARLSANGLLDQTFDIGPGADGSIRALALQSDSRLLVGGLFNTINGTNRNGLARLSSDGKVDISFDPGAGADNPVLALSVQGDDKVIVGGAFSTFRGVSSPGLIRLNTNGTIDVSFNVGAGFNGSVYAVERQSDGKLLVGGNFISFNAVARTNLVRLNTDGTLDLTFNPTLAINAPVQAILAQPDGRILVGGGFTSVNGFVRRYLVRLDQTGGVDAGFLAAPDAGADNVVYAIKQQVDGKLVIGGDFKKFNGVTRNGITRLNDLDGATDPTINFGKGANAFVAALVIQPDRKILLGGGFTAYDGQTRKYLARIYGGSIAGPGTLEYELPVFTVSEASTNTIITVRRRGGTTSAVSVHYATADGSALAGQNYVSASGDLSFAEGETFQTFSVTILPNIAPDGDHVVQLGLSNFIGATPGPQPSATLVIEDDESTVRFIADEFSTSENPVSGNATIGVFRGGGTNTTVTVDFATGIGTALAGQDYLATNGTVVFLPGQVFKNFNVVILNDSLIEGNETIPLSLLNPSPGTTLGLSSAPLVIVDNDFSPGQFTFTTNNLVVNEGVGNALVTVLRTNGSIGPVSVRLRTSNGTALSILDYAAIDQLISFADGETIKEVLIPISNDATIEPVETFNLALSEPTGGTTILSGNATVTIVDNDAGIIVAAGVALASESFLPADSVIQPGETVTVQLGLRNVGVVDSSSVTATLVYNDGLTNDVPQTQSYGTLVAGGPSASRPFTFTALGTNGSHITATLIITSAAAPLAPVSYEFVLGQENIAAENSGLITINDNGPASPYPASLIVSNISGPLNHLSVTLHGLTHRYPDDLDILLVGPNGAKVMLMSDAGGGNANALVNATITFDDSAAAVIPDQTRITNGTYRAANYLAPFADTIAPFTPGTVWTNTSLATFNGINPNGVWSLYVVDDSGTDSGVISNGWSLNILTATPIGSAAEVRVSAVAPASVESGAPFNYTLTVANDGPADATGVNLTDLLPAGFSLNTVSVSQGTYSTASGTVTANLGTLGVGASATVTINGVVVGPRTITNAVNVTATQNDSNLSNNSASKVTVIAAPRLSIRRVGLNSVVEWRSPSTGYALESSSGANGPWTGVVSGITTANGTNSYNIPSGVSAFYRLRKP